MENWKAVIGYEGIYEVSDLGRVRSLGRRTWCRCGGSHFRQGKVLACAVDQSGYRRLTLVDLYGKRTMRTVHSIVAEAYIGSRPLNQQVRHLDGNSVNDAASNLEYGTAKQNAQDKKAYGRPQHGITHPRAKLTEDSIRKIRSADTSTYGSGIKLARAFGISYAHVHQIRTRKLWTHLDEAH